MLTAPAQSTLRTTSHTNVQERTKFRQSLPPEAMLLDLLKTIELQLQKREFFTAQPGSYNPLWFLAETERNIFLWRRSCSIVQQNEFEFWIDPFALIDKRAKQLSRSDPENPFINPLWGGSNSPSDGGLAELDYLEALAKTFSTMGGHPQALSMVGSLLADEQFGDTGLREMILLPVASHRAATLAGGTAPAR